MKNMAIKNSFFLCNRLKYMALPALLFFSPDIFSQNNITPFFKDAIKEKRVKVHNNIINNLIVKNLSVPLSDSTEEDWQGAFYAIQVIQYNEPWITEKIKIAFEVPQKRSTGFQSSLLELVYSLYPAEFLTEVIELAKQTKQPKILAACAEYIFINQQREKYKSLLLKKIHELSNDAEEKINPYLITIRNKLMYPNISVPPISDFLSKDYLSQNIIVYSFQRKNRNYPGMVIVRDKEGNFIRNQKGAVFSVPQLARSVTNLPGYLSDGNTPQGIYKITGFEISRSTSIGPTPNIQLLLPFEKRASVSNSISTTFTANYAALLPASWMTYYPIFESYNAGMAGRTEIIAHGTTVDPEYYYGKPYYPLTPTQGCLCTKELWSNIDGRQLESNQQKLVNAIKKAGGANGYWVVIEIDDQPKPVSLAEILPFIK
jgi:hypothetical protein